MSVEILKDDVDAAQEALNELAAWDRAGADPMNLPAAIQSAIELIVWAAKQSHPDAKNFVEFASDGADAWSVVIVRASSPNLSKALDILKETPA